jgi:hypothetical protein
MVSNQKPLNVTVCPTGRKLTASRGQCDFLAFFTVGRVLEARGIFVVLDKEYRSRVSQRLRRPEEVSKHFSEISNSDAVTKTNSCVYVQINNVV